MQTLTVFNLAVLLFLLPLSALAQEETAPIITSVSFQYPKLNDSPIPNTFSYPYQTAFKTGDETYATAFVVSDTAIVNAYIDARALGAGIVPMYDTGNMTPGGRQFQSAPLTVGAAVSGAQPVHAIASTAHGTSTKTVEVTVDNKRPELTFTQILRSALVLSASGILHDAGTAVRLFSIFVQFFDHNDLPVSNGNEYYGAQEGAALRALTNGAFSAVAIPILEGATEFSKAVSGRISILGKDEAGNVATTSQKFQLNAASTSPPHATTTPPIPPGTQPNVLFIPGIETSRLYTSDCPGGACTERRLWEPRSDRDLEELSFTEAGASIRQVYTKPEDVVTIAKWGPFAKDIYRNFFSLLSSLKENGTIGAWQTLAYDWRLSLTELASAQTEQTSRALASTSPNGKVTIIAHSNGGLVAKALLHRLGNSEAARLVDSLILVSVPQAGTAEAVALMLHGYGGSLPFDSCAALPLVGNLCASLLSRSASRSFAEHAPVAYHLLPSAAYFRTVSDGQHHVVEFHATRAFEKERSAYKSAVNSLNELHSFLQASEGGRSKPVKGDVAKANVLTNQTLLAYASSTHATIDAWTPPSSLRVFQIAGFGKSTLSGIDYDDYALPGGGVRTLYRPILSLEGDGTVQAQTSMLMKSAANVRSYWISLGRYDHGTLLESPDVEAVIESILQNGSTTSVARTTRPTAFPFRFTITLHSPLTLEARDARGRIASEDTVTIPEANYGELGEAKYLSLPDGEYDLVMHGTGSGTFTLDIQEIEDDAVLKTTTLAEIPVTPQTIARISIAREHTSALEVDLEGDGEQDFSLAPRRGYTVVYKPAAPKPETIKRIEEAATTTLETSTSTEPATQATAIAEEPDPPRPQIFEEAPEEPSSSTATQETEPESKQQAAAITALPASHMHRFLAFLYNALKTLLALVFRN